MLIAWALYRNQRSIADQQGIALATCELHVRMLLHALSTEINASIADQGGITKADTPPGRAHATACTALQTRTFQLRIKGALQMAHASCMLFLQKPALQVQGITKRTPN
jgi:hypothetical protein